jgi:hypothetical protein
MARAGLYITEVKKARDALRAMGKHPSVDAVRIALGNTGSKTTIHKYLKQLEEDEPGTRDASASVSTAIDALVAQLAAQLQGEASAQIEALRLESAQTDLSHAAALSALRGENDAMALQFKLAEAARHAEMVAHADTRRLLQAELIARLSADQKVGSLLERLAENVAHLQSIEEKHQHARESLAHYRESAKEQRDQDLRRHEQQIGQLQAELRTLQQTLVVKQGEISHLHQDGARLVADLSHANKALFDEQGKAQRQITRIEALQSVEQRERLLTVQAEALTGQLALLRDELAAARSGNDALVLQVRELELALARAESRLEAQSDLAGQLRLHLLEAVKKRQRIDKSETLD